MNAKIRALAAIPAVALTFSLAACGGSDSKDDAKDTGATASAPADAGAADAGAAEGGAAGGEAGEEAGEKKEPPLTGAIKEKAEKAALAAHPGTVLKSEEDQENPGLYAVEVKKGDGTSIEVYLDKSFKVVKTKEEGTEENEG
ncbi:PepSY domain-containing protein [Streptomyces sp. 5-10]|uniref:PepSY domain-containing protein n=1 Tax=Streptomyces sp. 5-10 TaxID=878925 RepID=UPI00168AAFD8|nr:PepSY domain-containing protein [Streptomyces sp. 5-10]MBD3007955.1 PepSY domain-containing protein [Streptomyces sp. 5-10]